VFGIKNPTHLKSKIPCVESKTPLLTTNNFLGSSALVEEDGQTHAPRAVHNMHIISFVFYGC